MKSSRRTVHATRRRGWLRPCLAGLVVATCGCQAFAPASLGRLSTAHTDRKIAKQAAAEPFPSPADVGLSMGEPAQGP